MQLAQTVNLLTTSIKTIPGILPEDVRELQSLGIGSVAALMRVFEDFDGDATKLSTAAIVIDNTQSDRLGFGLLAHPQVPNSWKQKWNVAQPATAAPANNGTQQGTASQVKENGVVQLVKGILSGITLGVYKA